MSRRPILKADWQGSGAMRGLAVWLNTVARMLNNLRVISGGREDVRDDRIHLFMEPGVGLSDFAFGIRGYDHENQQIHVNGGPVLGHNEAVEVDTLSGTDPANVVTCGGTSGAKHYVYAYGTVSPLSAQIATTSTDTLPVHSDNAWVMPLFRVYLDSDSNVRVDRHIADILHVGLIDLKSHMAR